MRPPIDRRKRGNSHHWAPTALASCAVMALAATLGGCTTAPADGLPEVSRLTQERSGQPVALQHSQTDADTAQAHVAERLAQVLDAEGAIEIALLSNRHLQAQLGNLGLAEADYIDAGHLRNPQLSLSRLAGGGVLEIDRSMLFSLLDLLTKPKQREVAGLRVERARYQAALLAVAAAREAQLAFYEAVAARQFAAYARQVMDAADASSALAQRMAEAGNLSRLDQLREQAFRAEAQATLARREQAAVATRERLARALGLTGEQLARVQLPDHLAELPGAAPAQADAEQAASQRRLDIRMSRLDAEATALELGLTKATGFVNVLDLGWQNKSERGAPAQNGGALSVELPIFDFGTAKRTRAQTLYEQALNRAAAIAIDARSEVREAQAASYSAYLLARHYRDEVVPLRQHITEEHLRRYNGMLIDVFELLADAREQITSVTAAVSAQRDFWVANVRLQDAIDGGHLSQERSEGASLP